MDLDKEILTKNVCKDRDCSCWAPDTCRLVAHLTSFPLLAPPPPAGRLKVRTPYTDSVCHRAHSWRTKGTVSQACSIVCQTSCNISRYLVSPLPDQPPTAPLPRCSLQRALELYVLAEKDLSRLWRRSWACFYLPTPLQPIASQATTPSYTAGSSTQQRWSWWTRLCRRFAERTATRSRHMDMFSLETAGVTVTTRRAGRGALQGAQVQDGHILQVGRALPHQAPQH